MIVVTAPSKSVRHHCSCISLLLSMTASLLLSVIPIDAVAKKPWTFVVYMSAVNDLRGFAARNIKQMAQVGSNENVNIVVHLDILIASNKKVTRRYLIEEGQVFQTNAEEPDTQNMDSGDPQTLISAFSWAVRNYPADHYALIIWDHGTGIMDPTGRRRMINPNELFVYNPVTNKLDLDRNLGFLDYTHKPDQRGVCWDDITGNYLTNQKLDSALNEIKTTLLRGQKIDIIAFDACLMMMIEIANLVKPYANYVVGSQEVELGTGWNYALVLAPFQTAIPTPKNFAEHIVAVYQKAYQDVTNDFTQSAINLNLLGSLEDNVNKISTVLVNCLKNQKDKSVKKAIKASRNKQICTVFDEPTYIDLYDWYTNLNASTKHFSLLNATDEATNKRDISDLVAQGKTIIERIVAANTTGKNLSRARGVSIYFPEKTIHSSYKKTTFYKENAWGTFLTTYLGS